MFCEKMITIKLLKILVRRTWACSPNFAHKIGRVLQLWIPVVRLSGQPDMIFKILYVFTWCYVLEIRISTFANNFWTEKNIQRFLVDNVQLTMLVWYVTQIRVAEQKIEFRFSRASWLRLKMPYIILSTQIICVVALISLSGSTQYTAMYCTTRHLLCNTLHCTVLHITPYCTAQHITSWCCFFNNW